MLCLRKTRTHRQNMPLPKTHSVQKALSSPSERSKKRVNTASIKYPQPRHNSRKSTPIQRHNTAKNPDVIVKIPVLPIRSKLRASLTTAKLRNRNDPLTPSDTYNSINHTREKHCTRENRKMHSFSILQHIARCLVFLNYKIHIFRSTHTATSTTTVPRYNSSTSDTAVNMQHTSLRAVPFFLNSAAFRTLSTKCGFRGTLSSFRRVT